MPSAILTCHALTPTDAVRRIEARVRRGVDALELSFVIEGEIERLRLPATTRPRIAHLLWEHTCCESFIAVEGSAAYHELNLAPSGEWAAYTFRAYREFVSAAEDDGLAPDIAVCTQPDRFELDARVRLQHLSPLHLRAPLRVALATVVEDHRGTLSYWALHHPVGKADFHHPDAFVLRLEPPGDAC